MGRNNNPNVKDERIYLQIPRKVANTGSRPFLGLASDGWCVPCLVEDEIKS